MANNAANANIFLNQVEWHTILPPQRQAGIYSVVEFFLAIAYFPESLE